MFVAETMTVLLKKKLIANFTLSKSLNNDQFLDHSPPQKWGNLI